MDIRVIDAHCDVLSKMLMDPQIDFDDATHLDVTLPRLKKANILMQTFAVYLPQSMHPFSFQAVLKCVDLFHSRILRRPEMIFVKNKTDLLRLKEGEAIGALLALEGADGLEADLSNIGIMHQLGLRQLGLTWNYANWAADGVLEPRGAGFSLLGRKLVKECERLGIILDVSHLNENGFWELVELYDRPFIATHSNVYEACPHPRNLKREQITEIIKRGGMIGITFVPGFVRRDGPVAIKDLLVHIDLICSMGGAMNIGFGSDFDGIDHWIEGLEHPGKYGNLIEVLQKHYSEGQIERMLWGNWFDFYRVQLPN